MTKTPKEIETLARGGALLSRALKAACDLVKPGAIVRDLDAEAERVIIEAGGTPSFKGYGGDDGSPPFPSTVCISINDEIVHGLGNRKVALKEGDIVGLDIGCWYEGLCTDMAVTVPVGKVSPEAIQLMQATRASLEEAVKAAKVGGFISDIGAAVERVVQPHGYGIVRALVGHGVGHEVHEAPHVPNFTDPKYPKVKITEGMVLAIEPMIGLGTHKVQTAKDGWSVLMADGKIGAHFEVTVACTKDGTKILTPLPV